MLGKFLIVAAAVALSSTTASAAPAATSSAYDVMWFADSYASAYYSLDQRRHEVVTRFEAGSKGGNPIFARRALLEGASERLTIDGTGRNHIRATLVVSRRAGRLSAEIRTEVLPDRQASN